MANKVGAAREDKPMIEQVDPMKWEPDYSYTDEPIPLGAPHDGITPIEFWKRANNRMNAFERARRNPMLKAIDSEGRLLYRLTSSGGLRRTFPLSKTLIRSAKERDNHQCVVCGSTKNLEVDHIVRYVDGGGNDLSNLRTLCASCHRKRGGRREDPFDQT